ncbi:MAG: hypothetical protein K9N09_08210 [Candidatus Cloacimonetes bacterium]|nr:hypothetical protein [Candidatus Cloacimonadota bacterium]MCF7868668.1 hypothetical protein [Candidatus Cloacimonadota bacterium]
MNIEFHYYMTKYLAIMAGFENDEAETIAYSSQFVDDNKIRYEIEKPDGEIYKNYITQTMNILKPKKNLMRIYLLYHFLPGDPTSYKASRRDGKMHVLMTTPASNHAQEIFFETTKTESLYALGIATHMLADSVSHQNFVGTFDEVNSMKGVWEKLTPDIGHADAGHLPDIPNLVWNDCRLIKSHAEIDNKERLLLAAKKLYSNFLMITSNPSKWSTTKKTLNEIIGETIEEKELSKYEKQKKERIEKIREILAEENVDEEYDRFKWLNDAVDIDVKLFNDSKFRYDPVKDKLKFKKNFESSNWFKFQEAVREYQRTAMIKLEPILTQLEIKEW